MASPKVFGGFVHPLQGLDHLIAAISVGAMAARMDGRALWVLPTAFLSMIALGAFIGMRGGLWPFAGTGILLSHAAFGLALLLNWKAPAPAAAAVAGLFATFHGYMHGTEMIAGEHDGHATAEEMVKVLKEDEETIAATLRALAETADRLGDMLTNDIAIVRAEKHEKYA